MTHTEHTGQVFALQYLEKTQKERLRLSLPQEAAEDEELAGAISDVFFNLCADDQYRLMISRYLSRQLPKDARPKLTAALKKLRRDGFLMHKKGSPYVEERTALIALAFVLNGHLPAHSGTVSPVQTANLLLKTAGFDRLYPRCVEDAGVIFALNNHIDLDQWDREIHPLCLDHQARLSTREPVTLGDLRTFVKSQESQEGITVDRTGFAYDELLTLKGGPGLFADYLKRLEPVYFAAARERARLYLCRALLTVIDHQVQDFLTFRDTTFDQKGLRFVREDFALEADKLWLKGTPVGEVPDSFRSNSGVLALSALLQNKSLTAKLKVEDFDCLTLRVQHICDELDAFWEQPQMGGVFLSGRDFKHLLSGTISLSRAMLIRLLVFLDGTDAPFVNNRLIRAGFSPLDPVNNLDDALMHIVLQHPKHSQRKAFLQAFCHTLQEHNLTYSSLRLLNSSTQKSF